MAITIVYGNVGKTFAKPNNPSLAPGSKVTVNASAAADIAIVPAHQLFARGVLDFGTTFQLAQSGGTVKVDLSLSPIELIRNDQTDAAWHELAATLANNAMISTTLIFTCIRLTFNGSGGVCFIAAM